MITYEENENNSGNDKNWKPIDWSKLLNDKSNFEDQEKVDELKDKAESWTTCVTSKFPVEILDRDNDGEPTKKLVSHLGVAFGNAVKEKRPDVAKSIMKTVNLLIEQMVDEHIQEATTELNASHKFLNELKAKNKGK